MPPGTDCVAPFDAVRMRNGQAEALAALAPGEGVLPAGGDHDGSAALCHSGARLTQTQIAALAALGVAHVRVRRPRVVIAPARSDAILHSAADFVRGDLQRRGAAVESAASLDAAVAHDADAVVVIGGTGSGENDASAETLAARGRLLVHGIALSPGETAGFGIVGTRPVLLLPGRLDAAIAVWLMLGRALLDALAGAKAEQSGETLTLARKITSTLGITELIPVRRNGGKAEPLAARYWPLSAIARADGIIVISPESEGASAGAAVQVWPFA
jgi:molybdopterin biosynthesis enzyme